MIKKFLNLLKNIKPYNYENYLIKKNINLNNNILEECVHLRRKHYNISNLPYKNFNYLQNLNRNCENIIGYTRIPTGIIGPVNINYQTNYVPIATTEGALISSINRGCKVLNMSKTNINVEDVGMTRSPIIKCNSLNEVCERLNIDMYSPGRMQAYLPGRMQAYSQVKKNKDELILDIMQRRRVECKKYIKSCTSLNE